MVDVLRKKGDGDKTFCIFAVKVNSDDSVGRRKLTPNSPYYLMKGFEIDGDNVYIDEWRFQSFEDSLYVGVFGGDDKVQVINKWPIFPHVNISAIVGCNGSGKSTLVEFAIRIINNLSACIYSEIKPNDATDRLHYINGICGDLYYMLYNNVYCISIDNKSVRIKKFYYDSSYKGTERRMYRFTNDVEYDNHKSKNDINKVIESGYPLFRSHCHFFYTLVDNHSLYAYNTNDYSDEVNDNEIENEAEQIYRNKDKSEFIHKNYSVDERCWLHGLFHKNDGYQRPLVLTPFRKEGNIDINNENELAIERLVSLLVNPDSNFRTINDHLLFKSLHIRRSGEKYDIKKVNDKLGLNIKKSYYNKLRSSIISSWCHVLDLSLMKSIRSIRILSKRKKYSDDAWNYIVYKTLKISKQYEPYNWFFKLLKSGNYDAPNVQNLINQLKLDNSHITKKIHQTLSYLLFDIYTDDVVDKGFIDMDILKGKESDIRTNNSDIGCNINRIKERLIPAPIFDVIINLEDKETGTSVPFETLSSGEKQLVYTVSSLLYHLKNIDSVKSDSNDVRYVYEHVNIILEEVELYFHPEQQKKFIKYLLDSLATMTFMSLRGLNIIIITHSPFVLSDIPACNILALDENGSPQSGLRSLGANIHEMLKDSFFLKNGTIGDFAQWHINQIIKQLDDNKKQVDKEKLQRMIMLIDEPVIKLTLLEQYKKKFPDEKSDLKAMAYVKELEALGYLVDLKKQN